MAFVVQSSPMGAKAVGVGGGGLAYEGVSPSIAVEFDTFFNPATDPQPNHVAFLAAGNPSIHIAHAAPPFLLNDGAVHYVWIDYDWTIDLLEVYLARRGNEAGCSSLQARGGVVRCGAREIKSISAHRPQRERCATSTSCTVKRGSSRRPSPSAASGRAHRPTSFPLIFSSRDSRLAALLSRFTDRHRHSCMVDRTRWLSSSWLVATLLGVLPACEGEVGEVAEPGSTAARSSRGTAGLEPRAHRRSECGSCRSECCRLAGLSPTSRTKNI